MRTDDLIARLASDAAGSPARPDNQRAVWVGVTCLTLVATVSVSMLFHEPRAGGPTNGVLGVGIWFALALAAIASAWRLRLPEPAPRRIVLGLAGGLVALTAGIAALNALDNGTVFRADHLLHCLQTIGLLAVIPFAGLSILMRRAAPASPLAAGVTAGILAGATGALAYAFSCPINDPYASLTAHAMTVCILSCIGALVGWRLYAW